MKKVFHNYDFLGIFKYKHAIKYLRREGVMLNNMDRLDEEEKIDFSPDFIESLSKIFFKD